MKNKLKYGLTLAALAFLVGCSDKGSIQRPSIGSGPTVQDSESTSEIDPVELSNYQYYPLPDKTLAIAVGNNKYLEKLTLPEQYQGRKVTQIAENGFKDCQALREISIPSSVLTIGNAAFSGCASLISIVVPEGVTSIGALAFDSCSRLTICCQAQSKPSGWNYNWNDFGCPVVWGCSGIGTSGSLNYRIDYKNGEESITITGCAGADFEAAIPETIGGVKVTAIAESAFRGCTSLTSIVIPESVASIGAYAFLDCSRLTICCQAQSKPSGWDEDWNPSYRPVVWGCIRTGNQDCLEYAVSSIEGVESATITGYTGSDASIAVPEAMGGAKVTAIADSAFEGCVSLTSIVIPEGVTAIGDSAFRGCTSLTSIAIPDGVAFIGACAFYGCTSLTSIAIPDGVAFIGNQAFYGCSSLTSIAIPDGVAFIDACAFYGCTSLTSIAIPDGVAFIGACAFYGCTSLTSIAIPDGVAFIGNQAFYGCSSLTSIVIPDGVTNIGNSAFYGCSSLTICCKARSKPSGWDEDWNPSYRPVVWGCIRAGNQDCLEYAVSSLEGVESATITGYTGSDASIAVPEAMGGAKVTAIADSAFEACFSLKGIVIPESVTNIGYRAFSGCTSLTSIVIPEGVTSIGAYAFLGCSSLTICCQAQSKPSGWNKKWNFSDWPVVWGCIRAGNQDCFEYAVTNIEGVESVTITGYTGSDASIAVPEAMGGVKVTAIADSAFRGCTSLTSIVIPEGVTTIGDWAFYGCSSLTIYCQAQSKPSGWSNYWNFSDCPVVWGYSGNGTSGSLN